MADGVHAVCRQSCRQTCLCNFGAMCIISLQDESRLFVLDRQFSCFYVANLESITWQEARAVSVESICTGRSICIVHKVRVTKVSISPLFVSSTGLRTAIAGTRTPLRLVPLYRVYHYIHLSPTTPCCRRSFRYPSRKQSLQDRTDIWRNVTI